MIIKDDELRHAVNIVQAAGLDVVIADQHRNLRAWLDATDGWPPAGWKPSE